MAAYVSPVRGIGFRDDREHGCSRSSLHGRIHGGPGNQSPGEEARPHTIALPPRSRLPPRRSMEKPTDATRAKLVARGLETQSTIHIEPAVTFEDEAAALMQPRCRTAAHAIASDEFDLGSCREDARSRAGTARCAKRRPNISNASMPLRSVRVHLRGIGRSNRRRRDWGCRDKDQRLASNGPIQR